ncbi:hypothetical protein L218DRAFT_134394 [Marasmius fiardii PR-910]|nr:hypothetical protein L218DRAFT_134394 [Marasmius fiardii PR-910]
MFNNSSSYLEFGSATLNSIHGNQQNNTYYLQHQNQVVPAPAVGKEWTVKMRQQFDWVPPGKINMMKIVSLQGVPRGQYEDNPDRLEDEERSDMTRAYRVAHLACLVEGTRESSPFLCVAYTGRDAQKLFKRDCLAFSRFRHANVMQLRGFSDSGTPMTLFHEGKRPLVRPSNLVLLKLFRPRTHSSTSRLAATP